MTTPDLSLAGVPTRAGPEMATAGNKRWYYRHPLVIRATHWVNVLCLVVLFMSGLQIFNAHPALYWGKASTFEHPFVAIGATGTDGDNPQGVTTGLGRSVATTGVYCRPSCPSRAASPENVRFHADFAAAERAGFRACLRCKPDVASPGQDRAALVSAACRRIAEAEEPLPLSELARASGLSPHHFQRVFKAAVGLSPAAYGRAVRADRVRAALDGDTAVTAALYEAGFNSSGRFYAAADAMLGMTPTARRRKGEGERIVFGVGESRLGAVLAAESGRGVCAIFLGDDPDALVRDLQVRFPKAELAPGGAAFEARMAQVVGVVQGDLPAADLPLDVRGAAFQQRVWQALRDIPAGATVTYAQIAERIGSPKAVRAVGSACGANPVAVAIPCHRVVRRDGGLSGYRWGVERKRALLDREAALSAAPATA